MKKILLLINSIFFTITTQAQTCEWARTVHTPSRPMSVAIREDVWGNNYLASYTETPQIGTTASFIEKRTATQQLIWQKTYAGDITIKDMEFNSQQHLIVIGAYDSTITLDGITLSSSPFYKSTFLFEADTAGNILWARSLNPINDAFEPVDLFVSQSDECYFTSELNGGAVQGFCAFHKTDVWGNNLQSEFNSNFDNRTYSHIIADAAGNVFLSGTCGNMANFVNLTPTSNESYQHFFAKYDAAFNAQWLLTRTYITFDHNNELATDGQNYYWAFDDFSGNNDTLKVVKVNSSGQILSELSGPMPSAFFSAPNFSVDHSGNSVLLVSQYNSHFIFRYDSNFNLLWQDTIRTQYSSFERNVDVQCYDSSFYVFGPFGNDTMPVSNFTVYNLNSGNNFPVDLYAAKWSFGQTTGVVENPKAENVSVYPNPAADHFIIQHNSKNVSAISVYSLSGQLIISQKVNKGDFATTVNTSSLASGFYLLKVVDESNVSLLNQKLLVVH